MEAKGLTANKLKFGLKQELVFKCKLMFGWCFVQVEVGRKRRG